MKISELPIFEAKTERVRAGLIVGVRVETWGETIILSLVSSQSQKEECSLAVSWAFFIKWRPLVGEVVVLSEDGKTTKQVFFSENFYKEFKRL